MRLPHVLPAALFVVMALPLGAQQTNGSPHGTLPEDLDCVACHTPDGWTPLREPMEFDHDARVGFTLTGAHQDVACVGCHEALRFDAPEVSMADCASCHRDAHEGQMVRDCADCHQTRSFQEIDGETLHSRTSFPLTGAHRQVTCESCHIDDVGGSYSPLEPDCMSCHAEDYDGALTVDHEANGYPTDCTECHSTTGWNDAPDFDHSQVGWGFALVGAHEGLRCASCHQVPGMEPLFQPAGQNDCVSCHLPDYQEEHGGTTFPMTCLSCHGIESWDVTDFDHDFAGFPLVERHGQLSCSECHTEGSNELKFPSPTGPEDCVACHQADYDDEHRDSGFPTTCLECHTQRDWEASSFNHSTTSFLLEGPHAVPECSACHTPPTATAALVSGPEDCVVCHQGEYDTNHAGSDISTQCAECHGGDTWEGAEFDHAQTSFALEGVHATAACETCHTNPDYGLLFPSPTGQDDCVACHQGEYDTNHAGSEIPTGCTQCHSGDTWEGAEFDHAQTSFALEGVHATAACETCHTTPDYGLLFPSPAGQDDCVACHQGEYDTNHADSGFPTACADCHSGDTWEGATADHMALSGGFALEGVHATAACETCHTVPDYGLLFPSPTGPNDCVACHQGEYDTNHAGSSVPTTCLDCHSGDTWEGATADHVTLSGGFALEGVHATAACETCHSVPDYGLLFPSPAGPEDCVACHQGEYDTNHAGSSFPTTCLDCHTGDTWLDATVDHVALSNGFALEGVHATAACETCHSVPDYGLLFPSPTGPDDCVACHQGEYDANHGGSGYPTTCMDCHTVQAWSPSTFDHDAQYFPIYSGDHAQEWNECSDCHNNPANVAQVYCLSCHDHSKERMDDKHSGEPDYTYTTAACLTCHPRGRS